ncbi:hypothetical protein [Paraburkholderia youngii]|uniref:hypothetical protein n=1 Tax=Paraburkholderia youngii TaxID=2782701 RepID=UPI003D22D2C1
MCQMPVDKATTEKEPETITEKTASIQAEQNFPGWHTPMSKAEKARANTAARSRSKKITQLKPIWLNGASTHWTIEVNWGDGWHRWGTLSRADGSTQLRDQRVDAELRLWPEDRNP